MTRAIMWWKFLSRKYIGLLIKLYIWIIPIFHCFTVKILYFSIIFFSRPPTCTTRGKQKREEREYYNLRGSCCCCCCGDSSVDCPDYHYKEAKVRVWGRLRAWQGSPRDIDCVILYRVTFRRICYFLSWWRQYNLCFFMFRRKSKKHGEDNHGFTNGKLTDINDHE
jgi:hypothetical protein